MSKPNYIAKDGYEANAEQRAILDYIHRRFNGDYQLGVSTLDDGSLEYHVTTQSACCHFADLDGLKEFLGEPQWQN
jgi:hypothetical protein